MKDYQERTYLSAIEAAKYLNLSVKTLEQFVKSGKLKTTIAASGQRRFSLSDLKALGAQQSKKTHKQRPSRINIIEQNSTTQTIIVGSSTEMKELAEASVHLIVTSPPYFNAKMYARLRPARDARRNNGTPVQHRMRSYDHTHPRCH